MQEKPAGLRQKVVFGIKQDLFLLLLLRHLSGEQFVSLREFKGDQCQVPSPPLNDDQYVSDVQFDRNPCPHLVNALSVAQVITGRAQCVSCGLTWALGGAVFVLKWGGVLV